MVSREQQVLFDLHGSNLILTVSTIMVPDKRGENIELQRGRVSQDT